MRAHLPGQEVFKLRIARTARAHPHRLAARRRIDIEPGGKLGERIVLGIVDPMRAEIEWNAEGLAIGDAAAADPACGLDQHEALLGRGNTPRGGDTGGAGADDQHVHIDVRGNGHGGLGHERGGNGEEGTAAKRRHGIRKLDGRAGRLPEPAWRGKFHG